MFPNEVFSQAPRGEFGELIVLDNLDTLSIQRKHTDWWFGVTGGASYGFGLSKLNIPEIIADNGTPIGDIINYNTGELAGFSLGLYGEWLPIDEMWGVSLKINLYDFRTVNSESDAQPDTFSTIYQNTVKTNYITISPSARYNLPIEHLYLFSGLDLEFKLSNEVSGKRIFENSARIDVDRIINMNTSGFRAAFHFGIGYDVFAADINRKVRAFISPNASIHIGTKEISEFGSSRIPFFIKGGVNVKFNIDDVKYDTLILNPDFIEPPALTVKVSRDAGIDYAGVRNEVQIAAQLLEMPKRIVETVKNDQNIKVEETVKVQPKKEEPQKKNININPNQKKIFYYPSSMSSTLTTINKEWLDALADYLIKNPQATVRITGHSDNAGTTEQNMERSVQRASNIVNYLLKKGISRRRMLDRGRGALEPVADNTSDAGRAKNRRAEIQIVQ